MTDIRRYVAKKQLVADWQGNGHEKENSQTFCCRCYEKAYRVKEPDKFITFEDQIMDRLYQFR